MQLHFFRFHMDSTSPFRIPNLHSLPIFSDCFVSQVLSNSLTRTIPTIRKTSAKANMLRKHTLDTITAFIGTMLIGSGLYGVLYPSDMARVFGVVHVNRDMAVFYPGVGGRNLSAGLAVWWMTLAGQRKAMGMFLLCWICTGLADTYLLLIHYAEVDTVWLHVFNTLVLAIVSRMLLKA